MPDNSKLPLVSAIIITHNRKELVVKAVRSVLTQSYPEIELVVVDDASTDGAKDVLGELSRTEDFTYIYIPPQQSRGGNYARNTGIRHSSGELIAFLDDDDEWMPEKIGKQVNFLLEHPDYGVVSCYRIIEEDLKERYEHGAHFPEGDVKEAIFTGIPYITSTVMIRRSVLEQCGLFDEELSFWQEYELSIRYTQLTKAGFVHEYLCLYRVIKSDKERLTNKLEGWENAVEYIRNKHKDLIDALPDETLRSFDRMIARDGLARAETVGDLEKANRFYTYIIRNEPSRKNRIKLRIKRRLGPEKTKMVRKLKNKIGRVFLTDTPVD